MAAESVKPIQISKRKYQHKTKSAAVKELIEAGCTKVTTISDAAGCHHSLASRILKQYNLQYNQTEQFKNHRADLFAGIQERTLKTLTDEDIKKASVRDRTILLGTIYDKERLERGQASQIVQSNVITGSLKELVDLVTGRQDAVDITPR